MSLIKALIGGLIGGGIRAYLAILIQPMLRTPTPWAVLLAGLGAGLGVRLLCGQGRNFLTGVLAAVTAILAIVGTSYANSMVVISNAEDASQPIVVSPSETADADDVTGEEATSEEADTDAGEAVAEDDDAGEATEQEPGAEEATADADDGPAETDASDTSHTLPSGDVDRLTVPAAESKPQEVDWSSMEVILNGVSALLAFVMGSGSAPATVPSANASGSDAAKNEEDA